MSVNKNKSNLLTQSQLDSIKTCADKIEDAPLFSSKTDKVVDSKFDVPSLRAAFLKGKILRSHTILKCAFLHQPPDNLVRTSTSEMQATVDENGVSIPLDPLQIEVDNMDVIPAIIHTITTRLQPIVNIKFSFYEDEESKRLWNPNVADIRISFNPNGGAWSLLGRDILNSKTQKAKDKATMNLGWFDVPTTLHEFCHSLAMTHEHQNPIGKSINWNVDRVHQWAEESQGWDAKTTDANIIKKYTKDQINGSEYDPKSIMLYFFPGIIVNNDEGECCGNGTQQNFQFSPYDVLFLNKIYPTKGQNLTPEQFTVKFFNDNFNQVVDIETLKTQVQKNNARESGDDSADTDEEEAQKFEKRKKMEKFEEDIPIKEDLGGDSHHAIQYKKEDEKKEGYYNKRKFNKIKNRKRTEEEGKESNFYTSNLFIILIVILFILIGYFLIVNCMSSEKVAEETISNVNDNIILPDNDK